MAEQTGIQAMEAAISREKNRVEQFTKEVQAILDFCVAACNLARNNSCEITIRKDEKVPTIIFDSSGKMYVDGVNRVALENSLASWSSLVANEDSLIAVMLAALEGDVEIIVNLWKR